MKLATFHYVRGLWSAPFADLDSERTVVIAFAAPSYGERPELFAELAEAYPRSAVIGCSTSGEIDGGSIRDESVIVAVARFDKTRVRHAQAHIESAEHSFAAGSALADQLHAPELRVVLVLSRGHEVSGSELSRGLDTKLGESVVVAGGYAGDGGRAGGTFVIADGKPRTDSVVAVGLYGSHVRVARRPDLDVPPPVLCIAIGRGARTETPTPPGAEQIGFYGHGAIQHDATMTWTLVGETI